MVLLGAAGGLSAGGVVGGIVGPPLVSALGSDNGAGLVGATGASEAGGLPPKSLEPNAPESPAGADGTVGAPAGELDTKSSI